MTIRARFEALRRRDDTGTSLVIALIFITIVAVALTAILGLADANLRATVELRKQAAETAGAEAAAQIAIDKMRHSSYLSGNACFDGASELTLNNAYLAPNGSAQPAYVSCEPDDPTSFVSSYTRPGYALLTLPDVGSGEHGIDMHVQGNNAKVHIGGDAASRTDIVTQSQGEMTVDGDIFALTDGDCSGNKLIIQQATPVTTPPYAKNCNAGSIPNIPTYAPPALTAGTSKRCSAVSNTTTPACTAADLYNPGCQARIQLDPGIYPDLNVLKNAADCNQMKVLDFRPGRYYFTFAGTWDLHDGTLVGGATAQTGNSAPNIPGACPSVTETTTVNANVGVTFVFGNQARWLITGKGKVELCGTRYADETPPIAVYGLGNTSLTNGSVTVPAQTGCVATFASRCALIETNQNSTNDVDIRMQGMVYAPRSWITLDLRKSTLQYFNDGIIARSFEVFSPASATLPTPVASVPTSTPGPSWSVVNLTVRVCPGAATCTATPGAVRLKAKVGILDPTGVPATNGSRQAKIYTWSVQR